MESTSALGASAEEDGKRAVEDLGEDGAEERLVGPCVIDINSNPPPPAVETTPEPATSSQPCSSPSIPTTPPLSTSASSSPKPRLITMPTLPNLQDLTLHSPSSQIIGTPFATNSTRYEYPFPDSTSDPSSSSGSPRSSHHVSPTASVVSPSLGAFHLTSAAVLSSPPSTSSNTSTPTSYGPLHLKLRASANPPIPPSLVKKRPRWSLNLLGRRRSSHGSQSSAGESTETGSSILGSPSGLVSPREEKSEKR